MQAMQTALNDELEEKKEQIADHDFKMVAFSLGGKDYAIDILKVKEIANADRFTYVPNTSPFVVGVYNLRGEIIPVIDLRTFFNVEKIAKEQTTNTNANHENMIIVNLGDRRYGTIVDQIEKVVSISSSLIQPPHPLFGDINIKYISGIIEHHDNMYILLDIERIFGIESAETKEKKEEIVEKPLEVVTPAPQETIKKSLAPVVQEPIVQNHAPIVNSVEPITVAPVETAQDVEVLDFKFIADILAKHQGFFVSSINEKWVKNRFSEWKSKNGDNATLSNVSDVVDFLQSFNSVCTNSFWTKDYSDAVYSLLPDNPSKQITVWNAGCGSGYEAYSLACLLHRRYPDARVKIFAHDTDLILISSAAVLRVNDNLENSWYSEDLTKSVSGDLVFEPRITDSILFEYHDCSNLNSVPMVDLIFSRDMLSYNSEEKVQKILEDFHDRLKDNGLFIMGSNESLESNNNWQVNTKGTLIAYNKI